MLQRIIQGPYFHDLMAQPEALLALSKRLEEATSSIAPSSIAPLESNATSAKFKRIVLTGMGSSLHALYPLYRKLSKQNLSTHWIEAAELLNGFEFAYDRSTLLVAVSQSGESAEIVSLMKRANEFGAVIGITNGEESTLAKSSTANIFLSAGVESTVSCKTYVNTLAALQWLSTKLRGGDLSNTLDAIEVARLAIIDYLAKFEEHCSELLPLLSDVESIFVTGRGDSLATAGTGGLILKESTRKHAEGMSCAAFRHGPLEMANQKVLVLIFEGDDSESVLNRRLADDINQGGGKAFILGSNGQGPFKLESLPHEVRPMIEILPIQMISLALAARDGIEAGRFERASKITIIS